MQSQQQCELDTYRVIVFGRDGTELLLKNSAGGFVLPSVEIPRWERVAENLTAALKQDWGCETVCLFDLDSSSAGTHATNHRYDVMECWREGVGTASLWKPIQSLRSSSFLHPDEFRALEQGIRQLKEYERDSSFPFAKRGWLSALRRWIAEVIRRLHFELTDSFRQYNASLQFNLVRFETSGPAVWFKAVGQPNLREFPITLKLTELFPRFLPEILGTKPEVSGWLSREVTGRNLGGAKDIALWERAADDLAKLQIESIAESDSLLAVGAHDLRFDVLFASIDPFFALVGRLMDEQPKCPPEILSREELSLVRGLVDHVLTLLADLQIPHTVGHLDPNPWNIIASADGCVFLDWAEGYVGHPLFSLEYLLQHFRREAASSADSSSKLIEAYKGRWRQRLSDHRISHALALTPLAAVFAYAVGTSTWKDEGRLRDPKIDGYFRSLARRMKREAMEFERRSICPR